MKPVIAVLDEDKRFADRLARMANKNGRLPFEVIAFSSPEKLGAFSEKSPVEILLLGEGMKPGDVEAKKQMILSEKPGPGEIYRFQSGDDIIREVMNTYSAGKKPEALRPAKGAPLFTVYSPLGLRGETLLGLSLALVLSERGRTLYVNLEDFSGLRELSGEETRRDLSDLIYHREQGTLSETALSAVVHSCRNMDWIPPVRYPEDLPPGSEKSLAGLMEDLAGMPGYRYLVADCGQSRRLSAGVLEQAKRIYLPVREDPVSEARIREFFAYLKASGREETAGRIRRVHLPEEELLPGSFPENLAGRAMRDLAMRLVKEEENGEKTGF